MKIVMDILGFITGVVLTLTFIIILLCVSAIGLAVLDYLLDSDIKGSLVKNLGLRPFLKHIHKNVEDIGGKLDEPTWREKAFQTYDKEEPKTLNDIYKE